MISDDLRSKGLIQDPDDKPRNSRLPAFISKPAGAPVYYGFPLIPETETDGFIYGAITDFLEPDSEEGCTYGDGFVQAPDGSRAGLVWTVDDEAHFSRLSGPEKGRWGVYEVTFSRPINSLDGLVKNFREVLPLINEAYDKLPG